MVSKYPVCPERIRRVPGQFSWVDHCLVRDGHIDLCSHASAALYLFLITVSDASGLSYYSDRSVMKRLNMNETVLEQSRAQLMHLDLIAYKKPIYQVLPLSGIQNPAQTRSARGPGQPQALGEIFRRMMKDVS